MGWTEDLVTGLAVLLSDAGVGQFPAGPVSTRPIFVGGMQPGPDTALSLTAYSAVADAQLSDITQPVQVRFRGTNDIRTVHDASDAVFDLLHGRTDFMLGPVHVVIATRNSTLPGGIDSNSRWTQNDNYYFRANRQTAYRLD